MKILTIFLIGFALSQQAAAQPIRGRAVKIIDGDTVDILTPAGKKFRVRVAGIDAPEIGQPFGRESKVKASTLLKGRLLFIFPMGKDRYRRVVARVCWSGHDCGHCLGYRLVREGLAYWYKRYSNDQRLAVAERYAKSKKIGIWSSIFVPPWVYRKKR